MAPFRKLNISRNAVPSTEVVDNKKLQPPTAGRPEVYQQRKRMLLEYRELFAVLMRLPDKELQKKLLDVVNNHRLIDYKTVETQTDPTQFNVARNIHHQEIFFDDGANPTHSRGSGNGTSKVRNTPISEEVVKKRKRKRKVSLPQANKESRTKQLAKMNKPKTVNGNNLSTTSSKVEADDSPKHRRINSFYISEYSSDVNIYEDTEANRAKEIEQCSYPLENGLLPIQDAVLSNQINKLHMHILIWQSYKNVDLNDILTEEDEDLLQLAVLNTCDPSVVNLLLEKGLNPNTLDADSNTVIHLAILNGITVSSFDNLMKHIDLKLFLTLNDDGYTPLHLAIRQDRYLLAESLVNTLDERLANKKVFYRSIDELESDEFVLKKQFKDYYERVCLQLSVDDETNSCTINNHDLKQQFLETGDRRSGNKPLYFAIDNRLEHLIFFLLAHFTDPRTENLSGLDCKSYFCEFGKSLNLSLNIEITMDKVIKILS